VGGTAGTALAAQAGAAARVARRERTDVERFDGLELSCDLRKDFGPIAFFAIVPYVMVVNDSSRASPKNGAMSSAGRA
jgi:hypothetical protein